MRHVITLSTIPPRFQAIGPTLQSLLHQKARPDAIELYIPRSYRRFPDWGGGLPDVPDGVTIRRIDDDLGPATKILPAAKAWRGQEVDLVYVDDDRVYGPDWTHNCLTLRRRHPRTAVCGIGFSINERYGYSAPEQPRPRMILTRNMFWTFEHQVKRLSRSVRRSFGVARPRPKPQIVGRSGYVEIAEGFGGVMVRPDYFDDAAWAVPRGLWAVDDIWLSGMMARQGIPVWVDRALCDVSSETEAGDAHPLYGAVIEGLDREQANRACIEYLQTTYGIWGGVATQSA